MQAGRSSERGARLARDRRGAAALEFALISIPFIGLVLGLMIVAYNFYVQEAVDFALAQSVRQVQLGQVPASYGAGDFTGKVFCPALIPFAPCNNVAVTVVPVSDYYSATVAASPSGGTYASGGFCVGAPGQLMFARAYYMLPTISQFWNYGPRASINGTVGGFIYSSAAFANENPSGAAVTQASGC